MRTFGRSLWLIPVLAVLVASPADAQSWKWDFGVNGGYAWFTSFLNEDDTGLPDDAPGSEVHFDDGFLVGTQLGYWFSPKLGLRANGRWADRPVNYSDLDANVVTSTHLWGLTGDLLFRFKEPAAEFAGMEVLPYLAAGLGVKWINPSFDDFQCVDLSEANQTNCGPFVTGGSFGPNRRNWAVAEKSRLAGLVGLGADWRFSRRMALRTEISDMIYKPTIWSTQPTANTFVWNMANDDNVGDMIHEIAVQVGLQFLFGLAPVPVVAVAPPPPPPPATPPPPAAVREEQISVCVIDPTAPGGIRMQTATLVERRDTFVVVGGTRTPLRQAVGNVTVVSGADWYTRGQPLVMTVGPQRVEYTTYGGTRVIAAEDLAYLGTINGLPTYADRDDVEDVIEELNELNAARRGTDLGAILEEHADLREELEDVQVVYVPMYATGCVFQGVQRQEEVRKGGK